MTHINQIIINSRIIKPDENSRIIKPNEDELNISDNHDVNCPYKFIEKVYFDYDNDIEIIKLDGSKITSSNIDKILSHKDIQNTKDHLRILIIKDITYDENWYMTQINYGIDNIQICGKNIYIVSHALYYTVYEMVFAFSDDTYLEKFIDTFIQRSSFVLKNESCVWLEEEYPIYKWNDTCIYVNEKTFNQNRLQKTIEEGSNNIKLASFTTFNFIQMSMCLLNSNVHGLDIYFNSPHDDQNNMSFIMETLNNCKSLTKLKIDAYRFDSLNIYEELANNTTITDLTIKCNDQTDFDKKVKIFCAKDSNMKKLYILNIRHVYISVETLLGLPSNTSLKCSYKCTCNIQFNKFIELCEYIHIHKIKLDISFVFLDEHQMRPFPFEILFDKFIHCPFVVHLFLNLTFDTRHFYKKIQTIHNQHTTRNKQLIDLL